MRACVGAFVRACVLARCVREYRFVLADVRMLFI